MRYSVIISLILFAVSVAVLIYYVVVMENFRFVVNTPNLNLDITMLALTAVSGVLAIMVYIFNSKGRGDVQALHSRGGENTG